MEFIINTHHFLDEQEKQSLQALGANVLHSSKYIPYLIVDYVMDGSSIPFNFPFIDSIKEGEKGNYFDEGEFLGQFSMTSKLFQKPLFMKHNLTGWGVKVAVLDSGVPQGVSSVEAADFTGTGLADRVGHSSLVTQVIKKTAPGVQLIFGKIGNEKPMETAALRAVEWAVNKGAQIINISSGFQVGNCKGNCTLGKLINTVSLSTKCAVVVAAGNDGISGYNTIYCPGCASEAVTVGAVDINNNLADYSSKGAPGIKKPNILAPGHYIYRGAPITGTSYAAPFISGILAATMNMNDIQDCIQYLYDTATDLGLPTNEQGFGLVNPGAFVEVIIRGRSNRRSKG